MKKHLYDFDFDLETFFDSLDLTLNYDDYDFSFDDIELDFDFEQCANKEKYFLHLLKLVENIPYITLKQERTKRNSPL